MTKLELCDRHWVESMEPNVEARSSKLITWKNSLIAAACSGVLVGAKMGSYRLAMAACLEMLNRLGFSGLEL